MADVPNDLELLLNDVRKTISDNKIFLKSLIEEQQPDENKDVDDQEELSPDVEDEFEEL